MRAPPSFGWMALLSLAALSASGLKLARTKRIWSITPSWSGSSRTSSFTARRGHELRRTLVEEGPCWRSRGGVDFWTGRLAMMV
jgi:hypothetical protein